MSYFSRFPTFLTQIENAQQTIEDLFIRIAAGPNYTKSSVLLVDYTVTDGERPEDISYKFYNTMDYHWVVLLINNITDPRQDWPMLDASLLTMVTLKYGKPHDIHHWRTVQGHHVISPYQSLIDSGGIESVDNYDYELAVNESKRQIKVLDPQYLSEFVSNFTQRIKS